jgi:gamma-glutamylcyclotransferase
MPLSEGRRAPRPGARMTLIPYFAYGSNMLLDRLKARCGSACLHGTASVPGYEIAFSKRSVDGSGKATLIAAASPSARVHGVVFSIIADDMEALDRFESAGRGYERRDGFVVEAAPGGERLAVSTYIAMPDFIDPALRPYDWYLGLVIEGAERAGLPTAYVEELQSTASIADPAPERATGLEARAILAALKTAGG